MPAARAAASVQETTRRSKDAPVISTTRRGAVVMKEAERGPGGKVDLDYTCSEKLSPTGPRGAKMSLTFVLCHPPDRRRFLSALSDLHQVQCSRE